MKVNEKMLFLRLFSLKALRAKEAHESAIRVRDALFHHTVSVFLWLRCAGNDTRCGPGIALGGKKTRKQVMLVHGNSWWSFVFTHKYTSSPFNGEVSLRVRARMCGCVFCRLSASVWKELLYLVLSLSLLPSPPLFICHLSQYLSDSLALSIILSVRFALENSHSLDLTNTPWGWNI